MTGDFDDYRQPVQTLDGTVIPNLENWGLGVVFGWHGLWFVIGVAWLLWWVRRPLLIPRYLALRAGREGALITRHDRVVAVGLLVAVIALVAGGFYWAEAKYPSTIPL